MFEATKIDSKNMLESTQFHNSKIIRKYGCFLGLISVPKLVSPKHNSVAIYSA